MRSNSVFYYILRLIAGFIFLMLFALLYWSSVLMEKDLKSIQLHLSQIKNELLSIKKEIHKNPPISHSSLPTTSNPITSTLPAVKDNLLQEDPFYLSTLPELLGPAFIPPGIRKEASIGKPSNLHPFSQWSQVASWNNLCVLSLATNLTGKYETFAPYMALSMELRQNDEGKPEYWLILRQDLFWQPLDPQHFNEQVTLAPHFLQKHQVTAHDFKFYFDALMNPHVEEAQAVALRLYYSDIEEMRVVDDFTLVVRWKAQKIKNKEGKEVYQTKYLSKSLTGSLKPLARFVYQYFADGTKIVEEDSDSDTYRKNAIWAQNFSRHWANNIIVSCGAWSFNGFTDREIRFKRNPDYYQPLEALADEYEIKFKPSPDSMWEEFKTGALDLLEVPANLQGELAIFLKNENYQKYDKEKFKAKQLNYLARTYNYIGWNETRPFFNSRKVRQALTISIDRERIIRQNLNGMAVQTIGPFFPSSPSSNPLLKPYPFDLDLARQLLREEGWIDHDGDGIIDKLINGKYVPFEFNLTYYVKNSTTKSIVEYVATALKEVGIECHLKGVDIADLSAIFEDKDFDAIYLGWALSSPPEDPKQLWYSTGAKQKGSSNAIGFANAEADQVIDKLEYEANAEERIKLYHRFDAIIYEEAPYTFLYTPKTNLVYRDYLQNVFIPAEKQDLIPGANVGEPLPQLFWIKK